MVAYEGVATDSEYAEIRGLRRRLSSVVLLLRLTESSEEAPGQGAHHSGRVSDEMLEARIAGVDARIPWKAVVMYAASPSVMLVVVGKAYVPIARSFFQAEEQWQFARETVERRVVRAPSIQAPPATWRAVILWLTLLIVVFLAWHFAQMPRAR
jgi:hypothetical protein